MEAIAKLSKELTDSRTATASMKVQNEGLMKEVNFLKTQADELTKQLDYANDCLKELRTEREDSDLSKKMSKELFELQKNFTRISNECSNLQKSNEELRDENDALREEMRALRGVIGEPVSKRVRKIVLADANSDETVLVLNAALEVKNAAIEYSECQIRISGTTASAFSRGMTLFQPLKKFQAAVAKLIGFCAETDKVARSIWRIISHNKAALEKLSLQEATRLEQSAKQGLPNALDAHKFFMIPPEHAQIMVNHIMEYYVPHLQQLFSQLRTECGAT